MQKAKVYFHSVKKQDLKNVSKIARDLLEKIVAREKIVLEKEIPLKIHAGEPGNISYIKPKNYDGIISYFKEKNIKTYYVETTTVTGSRNSASGHIQVAKEHGFGQIPFRIFDGENGLNYTDVPVKAGHHFKSAKIASGFSDKKQVLVLSHFKGHIASGFGGAIKMLGIGFASRVGKIEQHAKNFTLSKKTINWGLDPLYRGLEFRERTAEYALAASKGKKNIYLAFALDIVKNCDCDGMPMEAIYKDLGIFASVDPVAIDKSCFEMLFQREGKKPFLGDDIFPYAEKIGLGTGKYELISA